MQLKFLVCAFLSASPFIVKAQNNIESSKPIAENINSNKSSNPLSEFGRPSVENSNTQEKSTTKNKTSKNKTVVKPNVSPSFDLEPGFQVPAGNEAYFTHIPLVGETGYYGENHDDALAFTKKYIDKNKVTLSRVKAKADMYFGMIDQTFKNAGLPLELKYVSVIESALNNTATSYVGAAGPWQFMPATGKMMGLVVNSKVDERRDWRKSTQAAAKYLGYLYDITDDWLLAIASYNCGPKPVLNAIKRTGSANFFAIKKYLPKETQNYVMAFIATATSFEKLNKYIETGVPDNFNWASLNNTAVNNSLYNNTKKVKLRWTKEELGQMAIVRIKTPIDLDILAMTIGCDRHTIGRWNYNYYDFLVDYQDGNKDEGYELRIPKDKIEAFFNKKSEMEKATIENL